MPFTSAYAISVSPRGPSIDTSNNGSPKSTSGVPRRRSAIQTLVPAQLLGIAKQLKRSRGCIERRTVAGDLRELVSRARGRRDGPDKVEDRERRIELYAVPRGDAERAARRRL